MALYKAPFPPWTGIWEAYALPFASDPFVGKALAHWLVESGRGLHHARPSPLSILSGPGHFRRHSRWRNLVFFARLWLSSVESPAGCLLAQPALRAEPVFLSQCHEDSWDASRQIAPPLAHPRSHPHDRACRRITEAMEEGEGCHRISPPLPSLSHWLPRSPLHLMLCFL
jgi:hypothetical protein